MFIFLTLFSLFSASVVSIVLSDAFVTSDQNTNVTMREVHAVLARQDTGQRVHTHRAFSYWLVRS